MLWQKYPGYAVGLKKHLQEFVCSLADVFDHRFNSLKRKACFTLYDPYFFKSFTTSAVFSTLPVEAIFSLTAIAGILITP